MTPNEFLPQCLIIILLHVSNRIERAERERESREVMGEQKMGKDEGVEEEEEEEEENSA